MEPVTEAGSSGSLGAKIIFGTKNTLVPESWLILCMSRGVLAYNEKISKELELPAINLTW